MGKHTRGKRQKFSLQLTRQDKIFYGTILLLTAIVTLAFVATGESNIFVIPAIFCIAFYWRKNRRTAKKQ